MMSLLFFKQKKNMHIPRTLTFRSIEKADFQLKSLKLRHEINLGIKIKALKNFKKHFILNCYFIFETILLIKLFL